MKKLMTFIEHEWTHRRCMLLVALLVTATIAAQVPSEQERFVPVVDTSHVDSLCDRAWKYFQTHHNDSVEHYASRALLLASDRTMPRRVRRAQFLLALGKHNLGKHAEAITLYEAYIASSEELNMPYDTSILLLNLAKCNTHLGNVAEGTRYFDAAFEALDESNYGHTYEYYFGLAWFFHKHKVYDEAIAMRRKVMALASEANDTSGIAWSTYCLGYEFNSADMNDSAYVYVAEAIPMAEEVGDRFLEWNTKACMGIIELDLGNLDSGVAWLEKAEPIGAEFGEEICCGNGAFLALALIHQGRLDDAQRHLTRAEEQLPEIADKEDKMHVLKALSQAYEQLGLTASALETYKHMERVEDTLAQEQYQAEVAALEVRSNTRALMAKIAEQESLIGDREQKIGAFKKITGALGILIALILLAWWLEYRRRQRKMQAYLEMLGEKSLFTPSPIEVDADPGPLHEIEQAILRSINDTDLRINDLAKTVGMSQRNLNRLVREESGMTTVQLVRTLRLEKAKALLKATNKTVAEIAYETGFTEPSYFTKVFKRTLGVSPTEWRKAPAA